MAKIQVTRDGKVLVTQNGGVLLGNEGGTPTIESLSITPTISSQTITAPSGVDGYSPITVSAVTSSIDQNIIAENIKKDIQILGVTGTVTELNGETRTETLTSSSENTFTPSSGKNAITSITVIPNNQNRNVTPSISSQTLSVNSGYSGNGTISVSAVTSSIDANIQAENIKKDVQILGVTGSYEGSGGSATIDSLTITPTTSSQTITASGSVDGYSPITVNAVTSSIDSNIIASNIKSGISILGVQGNATILNGDTLNVTPTTSAQTITPTTPKNGFTEVNVSAVTSSIDNNISAGNIKKDVQILGVTGTFEGDITPSGTLNVTQNGTYDVTNYASANVNVSGGGEFISIPREVKNGVYQMPTESFTFTLPDGTTDVGLYGLSNAFYDCTGLTSVDLSSLTTVSGQSSLSNAFYNCSSLTSIDLSSLTMVSGGSALNSAFYNCSSLTSIDLSSLTTVSGNNGLYHVFYNCSSLTSVDLSSLTTVSGSSGLYYAFYNCSSLTSIDLSSLTTVSGSNSLYDAFCNCSGLTSIDFPSLTTLSGSNSLFQAFSSCTALTDIYFRALTTTSFGSYTNQFNRMMNSTGTSKTHTIHFPSNMETKISTLDGYPLFGGTSGYVTLAYDLPATS